MTWLQTIWDSVRREWAPVTLKPIPPGLYTYPIPLAGGQRRVHLRVDSGGGGVMFIDVTEVIHLNATAVEMAKLALDHVPLAQAQTTLLRRFKVGDKAQFCKELADMYALGERLRVADGCPTCAITPWVHFKPLFSTPVKAPFKTDVALTYACNNACRHCYNEPERFTMRSLTREAWFRVFDKLAEVGVPHIILTGGEPTLHPDLAALVRYANDLGLMVGMNTNGRQLAQRDLVDELVQAGLNHVQVTLASSRADVHNAIVAAPAFTETVAGIRNALAGGLHTITNTTLTRRNQGHAIEIVNFLHDLGLRTFAMNGMIYAGGGLEEPDAIPAEEMTALLTAVRDRADELDMQFLWYTVTDYCRFSPVALELAPKRCNAAEYSMCIEPNGDVLPCQSYYATAGNLLKNSWDDIWNSSLFLSFRQRGDDPQAAGLPKACWDCPDLPLCGGGCRLERESHNHRVRASERGCSRARGSR